MTSRPSANEMQDLAGLSLSSNYAEVDPTAKVGDTTRVWPLAQVREHAVIGEECVIGRGAYIGVGVHIGDRVKVQNHALVYEPATLEDGSFIGPAVVLTNDRTPRATTPSGELKGSRDWSAVGVVVSTGASVGARAVCVAPVVIGRWAMVGAGAVVTRDVPNFAVVVGNPARQIGWVGRAGVRLTQQGSKTWVCPETGQRYHEAHGCLTEVTP